MRLMYYSALLATLSAGCSTRLDQGVGSTLSHQNVGADARSPSIDGASIVLCPSSIYGAVAIPESDRSSVDTVTTDGGCTVSDRTLAEVLVEGLFAPTCVVTLMLTDGSRLVATVNFTVYPEGTPCHASAATCLATADQPPTCSFERLDASPE
jgi:hypothetical protein